MDLFVIQSEKFSDNHFFIVDENNFQQKIGNSPEYRRLQSDEELSTLEIFQNGGDEKFEIIKGKPYDFFVAFMRKTFK